MREALRGALLSVLFLSGLALFGGPLTAQNSDPSGNTTCDDNGNCASNGNTVNAGNNGSGGTPGAGNPLAPGSGSGYGGGMGGPEGGYGPGAHECSFELGCPEWTEEEKDEINERARQNCAALGADRAQGWQKLIALSAAGAAWLAEKAKKRAVYVAIPAAVAAAIVAAEAAYAFCQAQGMG